MGYLTVQRRIILDIVKSLRTHPTAKDVFGFAKKKLSKISFATVYRTLDFLVKQKEVLELKFGDDAVKYDGCLRFHQHFICDICGKIYDLELSKMLNIDNELKTIPCHEVLTYNLELHGRCHKCKESKK